MKRHRTFIKVFLNPYLRYLGYSIVSVLDENDVFIRYEIKPYPQYCRKLK
jgi:hypothetical protein